MAETTDVTNRRDAEQRLHQAERALEESHPGSPPDPGWTPAPFEYQEFAPQPASGENATLDVLGDVELELKVELGRADMHLEEVLGLREGSVVALDKLVGDPVDVYVNRRLVARGELLVLDGNFCVRVVELIGDTTT